MRPLIIIALGLAALGLFFTAMRREEERVSLELVLKESMDHPCHSFSCVICPHYEALAKLSGPQKGAPLMFMKKCTHECESCKSVTY